MKKLSTWAKENNISYITAFNWFKSNKMPVKTFVSPSGSLFVIDDNKNINDSDVKTLVIYCRVSQSNRKQDMENQIQRCSDWAIINGYCIIKVFKEFASGMNDNRKEFWKMINSKPSIILIENKDRLTRFGFNYLKNLLDQLGTKIIVINETHNDEQDLMKDMISTITSFCCRLYSLRRAKNKIRKLKEAILNDND